MFHRVHTLQKPGNFGMMIRKYSRKIGSSVTEINRNRGSCVRRISLRLMRRVTYAIPGHGVVRGCLWRVEADEGGNAEDGYAVSLEGLGTRGIGMLGRDQTSANRIFALLVRNTVTPCALREILEELTDA